MARLVEALAAKVAAIGFDVLFSETDRAPADVFGHGAAAATRSERRAAQRRRRGFRPCARRSIRHSERARHPGQGSAPFPAKSGFTFIGQAPHAHLRTSTARSGQLSPRAPRGIGFVNWQADADRVVRRVPLLIVVNGQIQPSFAIECLRVAQGASTYLVKSADRGGPSPGRAPASRRSRSAT